MILGCCILYYSIDRKSIVIINLLILDGSATFCCNGSTHGSIFSIFFCFFSKCPLDKCSRFSLVGVCDKKIFPLERTCSVEFIFLCGTDFFHVFKLRTV